MTENPTSNHTQVWVIVSIMANGAPYTDVFSCEETAVEVCGHMRDLAKEKGEKGMFMVRRHVVDAVCKVIAEGHKNGGDAAMELHRKINTKSDFVFFEDVE